MIVVCGFLLKTEKRRRKVAYGIISKVKGLIHLSSSFFEMETGSCFFCRSITTSLRLKQVSSSSISLSLRQTCNLIAVSPPPSSFGSVCFNTHNHALCYSVPYLDTYHFVRCNSSSTKPAKPSRQIRRGGGSGRKVGVSSKPNIAKTSSITTGDRGARSTESNVKSVELEVAGNGRQTQDVANLKTHEEMKKEIDMGGLYQNGDPLGKKDLGKSVVKWLSQGMRAMATEFASAEAEGEFSDLRQRMGPGLAFVIQAQPYLSAIPMPLGLETICLKVCTHYPTLFDHFQRELRDVLQELQKKSLVDNWRDTSSWKLLKELANSG